MGASRPDWEILAPHPLSVVCFRYRPGVDGEDELEELNARLLAAVNATGEIFLSHTKIDGRYAVRLAVGNIRTGRDDVEAAWDILCREAARLAPAARSGA